MTKAPWLILMLFIGGLGFFQLQNWIQKRGYALRSANMELASALHRMQGALQKNIVPILLDKALAQNLSWKLHHSITSVLAARTVAGTIQDLSLWSGDCKLISHSGLKASRESCPIDSDAILSAKGNGRESIQWQGDWTVEGTNIVHKTTVPLPLVSEPIYLVAYSALDSDWLAQFPLLTEALSLAKGRIQLTALQNQDKAPRSMPQVVSLGSIDGKILGMLGVMGDGTGQGAAKISRIFESLAWLLWGVAATLGMIWLIRLRESVAKTTGFLSQILQWSQSVLKNSQVQNHVIDLDLASDSLEKMFVNQIKMMKQFQDSWAQMVKTHSQEIDDREQDKLKIEKIVQQQDQSLKDLKKTIRDLAGVESLQWQHASFIGPYQSKLVGLMDSLEDLMSTLKAGEIGNQEQQQCLCEWSDQIAKKGSRKFIRSLSETQGSREGVTALDDQIAALIAKSESQRVLMLAGMTLGSNLLREWEQSLKVVAHWNNLIAPQKEGHLWDHASSRNLLDWIADAQEMVLWNQGKSAQKDYFINQFKVDTDLLATAWDSAQVAALWTSALLQLYSVLLDQVGDVRMHRGPEKSSKIFTTMRTTGNGMHLIIYAAPLAHQGEDDISPHFDFYRETLRRVQGLLYDWGISCSILPQFKERIAYSLTWTLNTKNAEIHAISEPFVEPIFGDGKVINT